MGVIARPTFHAIVRRRIEVAATVTGNSADLTVGHGRIVLDFGGGQAASFASSLYVTVRKISFC